MRGAPVAPGGPAESRHFSSPRYELHLLGVIQKTLSSLCDIGRIDLRCSATHTSPDTKLNTKLLYCILAGPAPG